MIGVVCRLFKCTDLFSFYLVCQTIILLINCCKAGDVDAQASFHVYHSLEADAVPFYEYLGIIAVHSVRSGSAEFIQNKPLTVDSISKLKKLAESDGLYRIKVVDNSVSLNPISVFSFTKASTVYFPTFSREIIVTLDQNGHLVGVAVSTQPPYAHDDFLPDSNFQLFNTSVVVVNLATGPAPDTMTYIQRLEQEKAEKARGDQGDNRSFFAKYWMYIVPLVIFLLLSGASGPEGQGGR